VLEQVLGVLDRTSALAFAAFALSAFIFAFGLIATTAAFGVFVAAATAFGVFVATTATFSFVATLVATTVAFTLSEHIGNA
jgi:hypothetical protein